MRYESLILGVAVLVLGVYLVSSHGYVGSTYLPGLIGLPNPSSSSGNASFFPGVGGYSIGTVVALFGLGLVGNGLRSPGTGSTRSMAGATVSMPPELASALQRATGDPSKGSTVPGSDPRGPGLRPGTIYCARCGRGNTQDAKFCQQCGGPIAPAA